MLALLLFFACDPEKGDTGPVDADGDGFIALDDCDDRSASVHPNGEERCNGIDDDCDGVLDEGATDATAWYRDADGDGWGDEDERTDRCAGRTGEVQTEGDCNDSDNLSFPGAEESCDGVDNDCDGLTDEAGASGGQTWYTDADGDGWGDASGAVVTCQQEAGTVSDASDCDDGDAAIHPEAEEVCGDDADNDCNGEIDEDGDSARWYRDADGDGHGNAAEGTPACARPEGYVAAADDCDDEDGAISPDADEVCGDGLDNDCDGLIDDASAADAAEWYADTDGDGFGSPGSSEIACETPPGHVAAGTDCDDSSALTFPGASEVCDDGADNDCDDEIDENAGDALTAWADADGDGYGDAAEAVIACALPEGYVLDSSDCDDDNPDVNPAAAEICDEVDNDCDGEADGAGAAAGTVWYADADGDGYGDPAVTRTGCEVPAGYAADDTDCDDGDAAISPAADEVCDGEDNNCDGDTDIRGVTDAPTWYPDEDGDGYGDLYYPVEACDRPDDHLADGSDCDDDDEDVSPGEAEVCLDGVDNDCDGGALSCRFDAALDTEDADGERRASENSYSLSGWDVGAGGDIDGDGAGDLVIGAIGTDVDGQDYAGAAWLLQGPVTGRARLESADQAMFGDNDYDSAGAAVDVVPDADCEGGAALLAGLPGYDGEVYEAGALALSFETGGSIYASEADSFVYGKSYYTAVGWVAAAAGDVDDDGCGDLMGAGSGWYDSQLGVFFGPTATSVSFLDADALIVPSDASAYAWIAASGGTDYDGDGIGDIAVGERYATSTTTYEGLAAVLSGPPSDGVPTDGSLVFYSGQTYGYSGWSVALDGDANDDGYGDLAIGAPYADSGLGGGWLVLGPTTGTVGPDEAEATLSAEHTYTLVGYDLTLEGDIDGDGAHDWLAGAPEGADPYESAGAAVLWYGPPSGTLLLEDPGEDGTHIVPSTGDATTERWFGRAVAASDLNDDGCDDIIVGAPYSSDEGSTSNGTTYIFNGSGL